MFDQNHNQREIKIAIIYLLVVFLTIVGAFAFILKNNLQESLRKDLKISLLIDEVGELKESNEDLYRQMNSRNKNLTVIQSVLNKVHHNLASLQSETKSKQILLKELEIAQKELLNNVKNKEEIIAGLTVKNRQMEEELSLPTYDNEILDILILGQNRGLTDTIIIASVNPATQNIVFVSLPRDLYHNGRKINELYSKYGIQELQEAVRKITGIDTEKYVIFNFEAFTTMVDLVGGLDINVENDLIDHSYPGPDNSYRTVTFKKGLHHMDGETALKYARSRKSTTDFNRSYRQQQIILSLQQKAKELNILDKFDLALKMHAALSPHLKTDINFFEALGYYSNYKNYTAKSGNVISNQNYLYSTTSKSGQYILLPNGGSYAKIKSYVSGLINS